MVLRCTRLERIFACRFSTSGLVFRRHASLFTDSPHPEQSTHLPDTVHPPPRPKVAEYLRYVAQNSEVTLEDLESFRPQSHSPVGSTEYEAEYEALIAKLHRSFTAVQLRKFLNLYGIRVSKQIRKREAALTIIEKKWDWPSLAQSQKLARSRKEISTSGKLLARFAVWLFLQGIPSSSIGSSSSLPASRKRFGSEFLNVEP